MKFKNYANKHSKSSRIFSEEDIWNMKLATLVENEDAILAQNNEIGIPTEKELQNSKHTTWYENNGFWESNDGRSIYDNEQEGGSGNNGGSECVGSYPVSGYTRADGTVVSDYVRTCGAAHAGQDDSNNDNDNNNEKNDYNDTETPMLYGYVETSNLEEDEMLSSGDGVDTSNKQRITKDISWQKELAQKDFEVGKLQPLKEYYKISLDLVDGKHNIKNNKNNKFYRFSNLPASINKNVIQNKIVKSTNINDKAKINNTMVVTPTQESLLTQNILNSNQIKNIIKNEYENIINGKYEGKLLEGKISFDKPNISDIYKNPDKVNLFGVIHNADIYDLKQNDDGSISFVVLDYYDFEHWGHKMEQGLKETVIKYVNNNADKQQKAGFLNPYILYIPIKIPGNELKKF